MSETRREGHGSNHRHNISHQPRRQRRQVIAREGVQRRDMPRRGLRRIMKM